MPRLCFGGRCRRSYLIVRNAAYRTNHAFVFEQPVNRRKKLAVGIVLVLGSQLAMLRKLTIALITSAAANFDPLSARMEA
jgi:hypothetical protein